MLDIIQEIDRTIAQLQEARTLLSSDPSIAIGAKRRRPKGSRNETMKAPTKTKKGTMSAAGRARIAAAQKARWAAKKKAA